MGGLICSKKEAEDGVGKRGRKQPHRAILDATSGAISGCISRFIGAFGGLGDYTT